MKIKICGLRREQDIAYANELMPDYIGFIFAPGRKRTVSFSGGAALKKKLSPKIQAVGVFVDEEPERIATLYKDGTIDLAQLHGSEDKAYIEQLRVLAPSLPVIKAFVVKSDTDVISAQESSADFVLLDAGQGSGERFDLSLVRDFKRPFFLAGGLGPSNLDEVLLKAPASVFAVDLSSGVETDGSKDFQKMKQVIDIIRSRTS